MRAGQQTHNRHLDASRAIVAGTPHPTTVAPHDLDCARRLAENALAQLREAFRLVRTDNVLYVRAEQAGKAASDLRDSCAARMGKAH